VPGRGRIEILRDCRFNPLEEGEDVNMKGDHPEFTKIEREVLECQESEEKKNLPNLEE